MAESAYKVIELVGRGPESCWKAAGTAVSRDSRALPDLRRRP